MSDQSRCQALTQKGSQCTRQALAESKFCKMHSQIGQRKSAPKLEKPSTSGITGMSEKRKQELISQDKAGKQKRYQEQRDLLQNKGNLTEEEEEELNDLNDLLGKLSLNEQSGQGRQYLR